MTTLQSTVVSIYLIKAMADKRQNQAVALFLVYSKSVTHNTYLTKNINNAK